MKKSPPPTHTAYLHEAVNAFILPHTVQRVVKRIKKSGLKFNAVACRGVSGAIVAPLVAISLKKGLIVCRKPHDQSHGYSFEGHNEGGNYIIVDDFIDSGDTVRAIMQVCNLHCYDLNDIRNYLKSPCEYVSPLLCVGIFLYRRKIFNEIITQDGRDIPVFGCRENRRLISPGEPAVIVNQSKGKSP